MLDLGMLMYAGLLILVIWRFLCFYRCCGIWLSFLNYTSLLYVMLAGMLAYCLNGFFAAARDDLEQYYVIAHSEANPWSIHWLKPFVQLTPIAVLVTLVLAWFQTDAHIFEIHKGKGILKHDRAVQIIALPAVFGVMALASMVPILELVTGKIDQEMINSPFGVDLKDKFQKKIDEIRMNLHMGGSSEVLLSTGQHVWFDVLPEWEEGKRLALWRYETCFYVADLFEAWALYQFGMLVLGLIKESYKRQELSDSEAKREAARELLQSHQAVTTLTWLGTMSFVLVCVGQTACSLWPYVGGEGEKQEFLTLEFQFAGFIASGAAIYNVFVVEQAYHHQLAPCSPVLKFLSVKILVSLSFFQKGILVTLQVAQHFLPTLMQRFVKEVPVVGDIINMTDVQMHLFYPAVILAECFLAGIMHLWAWKPVETWYEEVASEKTPLMSEKIKIYDPIEPAEKAADVAV
mmetsp:Transcript_16525/g.36233  ORF Transcript_16525/g.36233 Transcript_16525/m.36233 type:complete len:461 (-) Transcript_16525:138-1520(-)